MEAAALQKLGRAGKKRKEEMKSTLKSLGLALVAVFAISAVVAASASAKYDSEVKETFTHGVNVGNQIFHTDAGTVTCETMTSAGTQVGETEVSAGVWTRKTTTSGNITYSKCTAFGFPAEVRMNGCEYEFLAPVSLVASTNIICPTKEGVKQKIEIIALGFCTMTVAEQSPSGTATFTNEGTGTTRDVKITSSVTGISYGGNCVKANTNGTYTGVTTVRGYSNAERTKQVGIWVTS